MLVTLPASQTSTTCAFVFKAVNRVKAGAPIGGDGQPTPDTQKVRLYVDGVLKEWKSFNQSGGYQPTAYNPLSPWNSFVVFWTPETPYYSSGSFTGAPGSSVTLRIEGYQNGLNIQAAWAFAYGLRYVTYEGGWSLGGDTGGTPMQNTGKFSSPDAGVANTKAIRMFQQAGGYLNTYGTYSLWPNWAGAMAVEGLLDVTPYPLISSQDAAMSVLPAEPANGIFLPNSLSYAPYWQDASQTTPGGGITYSINGGAYTMATVSGTPNAYTGAPLTATFSGVPVLQNLTSPVTFRLLQPNLGQYSYAVEGSDALASWTANLAATESITSLDTIFERVSQWRPALISRNPLGIPGGIP